MNKDILNFVWNNFPWLNNVYFDSLKKYSPDIYIYTERERERERERHTHTHTHTHRQLWLKVNATSIDHFDSSYDEDKYEILIKFFTSS